MELEQSRQIVFEYQNLLELEWSRGNGETEKTQEQETILKVQQTEQK